MGVDDAPVLSDTVRTQDRLEILKLLYAESCASWRALIDVRFKLLGLVPAVSAVALATLLGRAELSTAAGIGIAIFGLVVTFALMVYDQRNSQLHDELISTGRRIEAELGIAVGQIRGRPGSRGIVKHDFATALVYIATMSAWVFAALVFAAGD